MKVDFQDVRAIKLIKECIEKLSLNLEGFTVLTEVGTGVYVYTPVIAALAGASQVVAVTRDSVYGKAQDTIHHCSNLLESLQLLDRVSFETNKKEIRHFQQADIITNSGFLRPLDAEVLRHAKSSAVIPLMFEAWELRDSDIDIGFCKERKIKVAGTWENHPAIKVFDHVGVLAVKLCLGAGVEVLDNNIIVWSDDEFGEMAAAAFRSLGASSVTVTTEVEKVYELAAILDCIFIADYSEQREIIGAGGIIDLNRLVSINPAITMVHLYGEIDAAFAFKNGAHIYPGKKGYPQVMTETLGYVGLKPIINLQTAGFKVAQEMLTSKMSALSQPITF